MDFVHFSCPTGHRLKAGHQLFGKAIVCPRCRETALVPFPAQASVNSQTTSPSNLATSARPSALLPKPSSHLSDTGVMRILGDCDPLPAPPSNHDREDARKCPRCNLLVNALSSVCHNCQCFVGSKATTMQASG